MLALQHFLFHTLIIKTPIWLSSLPFDKTTKSLTLHLTFIVGAKDDKKLFGPTLPPQSSSIFPSITSHKDSNALSPPSKEADYGKPLPFFPTVDGKLPAKVPQVKPNNKSKFIKESSFNENNNKVESSKPSHPSVHQIIDNGHHTTNKEYPPGFHPNDPSNENDANSDSDYHRRPNYPGPGFFNPATSKDQYHNLNPYDNPNINPHGQNVNSGNKPGGPPTDLYNILGPNGPNLGQHLSIEQILQHIQGIDQNGPPQNQQPPPQQQQHTIPYLTGQFGQNNVNYPPPYVAHQVPHKNPQG